MRKLALCLGVSVLLVGGGGLAQAGPMIAAGSVLGLTGGVVVDTTGQTVTFENANPLSATFETGSFAELGSGGTVTLENTGKAIPWSSLTSGSDLSCGGGCIYTATGNGDTTTFDLTSETVSLANNSLSITGAGTATLTGYAPTPGVFAFSTQTDFGSAVVTFSTTTAAIAEPDSLAIFASGLTAMLGLAMLRRRARP